MICVTRLLRNLCDYDVCRCVIFRDFLIVQIHVKMMQKLEDEFILDLLVNPLSASVAPFTVQIN